MATGFKNKKRWLSEPPGYYANWRAAHPGYMTKWRAENPLLVLPLTSTELTLFFAWRLMRLSHKTAQQAAYDKKRYVKNLKKIKANGSHYHKNNRAKINARRNPLNRARRQADPNVKLRRLLSDRLLIALKGGRKTARTLELLSCPIEFFRTHIENQFVPGMTWGNHGVVWELDHILPCAEFHLQHSEEQEICFHWTNFQPLFVEDNRAKGDKVL